MRYEPEIEVRAQEEEDWDFARNRQVILKALMGEWSSSVFSTEVFVNQERFLGPNRDYPHQGLLVSMGEGVYKVIDGIMFSQEEGDGEVVRVGAHRARYIYPNLEVEFSFGGESLRVVLNREGLRVLPFVDMRGVNGESLGPIDVVYGGRWLRVNSGGLRVAIGPFKEIERVDYSTEWIYKLGSGFRYEDSEGYIRFVRETRRISAPAVCTLDGNEMKVLVEGLHNDDSVRDSSWISRVCFLEQKLRDVMILRLSTLRCFGISVQGVWFPEAGCWWFRFPWVRDALEGIISNFQVYMRVFGWENRIRTLAGTLMKILEGRRSLPSVLGGQDHSADGPPLLLYLCSILGGDLMEKAILVAADLLEEMEKRNLVGGGPPVLRGGLVACAPYQSWTDSKVDGIPCRLPEGWEDDDWNLPRYILPEVNGQWIRALRTLCISAPEACDGLRERLSEMEKAFEGRLWNGKFVSDILDSESHRRSEEITSTGLVGLTTAIHVFEREKVKVGYQQLRKLMVNRTMRALGDSTLPFGVAISKRVEPYLGDKEYHRSAIWPRDTPYLIELLGHLGLEIEVRGILLNNLDHMISEGGLLYANELFGHPVGRNPYSTGESMNPIPLKNPAQYWSHWCDSYLNRFIRLA